jgi:hypothetical protein
MVIAVKPPSTRTTAPVTNEDAFSDASQTVVPNNYSASPNRFMGVCPNICSVLSLVKIF